MQARVGVRRQGEDSHGVPDRHRHTLANVTTRPIQEGSHHANALESARRPSRHRRFLGHTCSRCPQRSAWPRGTDVTMIAAHGPIGRRGMDHDTDDIIIHRGRALDPIGTSRMGGGVEPY